MSSGISISSATYGVGTKIVNVTKAVTSHIQQGKLNFTVSPDALNVEDPAPGQTKTITITYSINGEASKTLTEKDGNMVSINPPPPTVTATAPASQHAMSAIGIIFRNLAIFFGVYLQTLSVFSAYEFGNHFISPYLWAGIAFFIPFFSFWLLPPIVFWIRLFSSTDII